MLVKSLSIPVLIAVSSFAAAQAPATTPDLEIASAQVRHITDLAVLVFEQQVAGEAGATVPTAYGQLDGAPVLAYVFPTMLAPSVVGFADVSGTLALAVTSHPDFDDTPLWDENGNARYDDDGSIYHTHWVVLGSDERVPGGLSVAAFDEGDPSVVMPPTHPGMPIYLDSPGFTVRTSGDTLQVLVPVARVNNQTDFTYDAVTAYLQANTSDPSRPMLGVYESYSVLSGDLSLPLNVTRE